MEGASEQQTGADGQQGSHSGRKAAERGEAEGERHDATREPAHEGPPVNNVFEGFLRYGKQPPPWQAGEEHEGGEEGGHDE